MELLGDVLGSTTAPCGAADNARVLTASRLIAQNACWLTD
jgi:hypothetical protein